MRHRRIALAALLAGPVLPSGVRADEVDDLTQRVVQIEARVKELDSELKPAPKGSEQDLADRRLIDAQVLYELKNYEAASTILLDIVQKYEHSSAYPEALYFLADSLYLERDFLSSRKYFEAVIELGPTGKRYQETLQRLIELSLYTGDYTPVDGYIKKLGEMPPGKQLASVPYVKGKYFYFRQRWDDALAAFAQIDQSHSYWFHAQYFVGATQVAQKKLVDAITTFGGILKVEPKTDSQKRIVELAHMALGRIFYDRAQFTNADTEYSKIGPRSELFAEALYEQAWVAIKAGEFKKAFHALDLLLLAKPDDPQVPEVKLLIGNLHIREGEWAGATESFTKTRDEFEPIHKSLDEILSKQTDPQRYFAELIGKNLGKFDVTSYLPPLVIKWVKASPDVEHLINVTNDVNDLKRSLDESEEIVKRLDKAITGPQRVNVFPELARARAQATGASNEVGDVEKKLFESERRLMAPVVGVERAQLDALAAQRASLEMRLANLPTSADSYDERLKKARSNFDGVDRALSELNVELASYSAKLVAIEKYYHDTQKDQKIDGQQFTQDVGGLRALEAELRGQYDQLRRDVDDAIQSVGIDDAQMQDEQAAKAQLEQVMQQEHDLGATVRARLQGADRVKVDQIETVLARVQAADHLLASFNTRIDGLVDDRLSEIKTALAEEKAHVAEYRLALSGDTGEATVVGAGITSESFKAVAERFYQIVVRADVGIVDVAWALKQNKTDEDQRLVREEKRELKLLDDEFKQVLKE